MKPIILRLRQWLCFHDPRGTKHSPFSQCIKCGKILPVIDRRWTS